MVVEEGDRASWVYTHIHILALPSVKLVPALGGGDLGCIGALGGWCRARIEGISSYNSTLLESIYTRGLALEREIGARIRCPPILQMSELKIPTMPREFTLPPPGVPTPAQLIEAELERDLKQAEAEMPLGPYERQPAKPPRRGLLVPYTTEGNYEGLLSWAGAVTEACIIMGDREEAHLRRIAALETQQRKLLAVLSTK